MPNGEDMSGDMGALAQARASRDQLFADAMKRLRDDRVGPSAAERLFAISKALSRPTRTGSFIEELGNVGGALGEQEAEKRKAQMERAAMLEKYGFGQSDATIAGLESQINMRMKMQAAEDARVRRLGAGTSPVTVGPDMVPRSRQFGTPIKDPPTQAIYDLQAYVTDPTNTPQDKNTARRNFNEKFGYGTAEIYGGVQ